MNGEVLVMTPKQKTVHELSSVAGFIFKEVDGEKTLNSVVSKIAEEFDAPIDTIIEDLLFLIPQMASKGLIEKIEIN